MNKKIMIGIIFVIVAIVIGAIFISNLNNNSNNSVSENVSNLENENNNETKVMEDDNIESKKDEDKVATSGKTLVTYFSLPETRGDAKEDSTITVNGEQLGNTQYVANLIQEHIGADIFRIEAVKQYNISDHQALIADAQEEQRQNARPKIKNKINNFEKYDTIFIGYPIWWSDLPQILYTFLESNVYLFSTNGGSGLASTVSTITNKLSGANVNSNAFMLHRNSMEDAPEEVEAWLKEINIVQ